MWKWRLDTPRGVAGRHITRRHLFAMLLLFCASGRLGEQYSFLRSTSVLSYQLTCACWLKAKMCQ